MRNKREFGEAGLMEGRVNEVYLLSLCFER